MDYCTGFFEGWWADCCQAHDANYLAQIGKLLADEKLYQCVADSLNGGSPVAIGASTVVAAIMFAGVRVFGRRFYRKAGKDAQVAQADKPDGKGQA